MIRKVLAVIFAVISLIIWVSTILSYIAYSRAVSRDAFGLVPVEDITGIYVEATLKRDGYIYEGNSFPVDSNGPWLSKWFMTGETKRRSGSDVRRLRIIDVYGDKCTIVYEVSKQDHSFERFATYDFPLSDLKYNEKKVAAAQDGKKTDFHGSGFSLELSEQKKGSWIILLMFFFPVLTILMEIIIFIPPKEKSALN